MLGLNGLKADDNLSEQLRYSITLTYITKTYLYNVDPLKPHFYNWGLQGYTLFFLFLLKT